MSVVRTWQVKTACSFILFCWCLLAAFPGTAAQVPSSQAAAIQQALGNAPQSVAAIAELEQRLARLREQYDALRQEREDLEAQYEVLQGSRMLHQILQEARASFREVSTEDFDEILAQLRLQLFQAQRQLRDQSMARDQRASLEGELDELEHRIGLMVDFMQVQGRLTAELNEYEHTLSEYLFWTPSNRQMDGHWLVSFPRNFSEQSRRIAEALSQLRGQLSVQSTALMLGLIILLAVSLLKRRVILQRLARYNADVASNAASSPWLILRALSLHALLALPLSLLILIAGQFINAPVGQGINLDKALNAVAGSLFVVSLLLRLLRPNGFAQLYFKWEDQQCIALRRFISYLGWVLVPLSFILAVSGQQTTQIGADVIGQLLLALASMYLIGLIIALFHKLPSLYGSTITHRLVGMALLLLPATLLLIVISGYYYTALMLSGYYLATFYVITVWMLTEAGVQRGLEFAYDRMQEHQRAQAALNEAVVALSDDGSKMTSPAPLQPAQSRVAAPEGENPALQPSAAEATVEPTQAEVDAQAAKQQSQRLARFGLMVFFAFVLYQVWSEATMALDYLDTQMLWADEETGRSTLSLGGIFSAVVIAVVGIVLVRNLPGLLEMTILSRLRLQMGTAYAVTSLVNYVIISIAIVSFLAALGVRWDQLQWLAAGLTVGLGFGLQEIFGNFISGLILFFERPLRVGDIVTLDTLSGRVTQIRIRATVITDFDRRDIIVPNRQFITGQFVNWSLSNTITRLTVKVGVAYGSDLEKTKQLLEQIADDEPRVLDDPAPVVLFLQFGASTLDHEMRVHVGSLADRMPTIDALNREIDRRFKEAGVEIAFNQIDVHFRNELGLERHIESVNGEPKGKPHQTRQKGKAGPEADDGAPDTIQGLEPDDSSR
ncbi:MAG: mechanosensitive ion channel [Idiomarina sp.]|nr:mechanosensitive ion channel [Idiomarina sp.]